MIVLMIDLIGWEIGTARAAKSTTPTVSTTPVSKPTIPADLELLPV